MLKTLERVWKKRGKSYYHALSIPILIAQDDSGVWYWYDPANEWSGGGFSSEESLRKYLKEKYFCSQCNFWHVPGVWKVEKKGRRYDIEELSFVSWVRT